MRFTYFGVNLRFHRRRLGLSQAQLAARARGGFSQVSISRLERGRRVSDISHLEHLAAALNVPASTLTRKPPQILNRCADAAPAIVLAYAGAR